MGQRQLERAVRCPTLRVVLELPQEHRREIDRQMDPGMLRHEVRHGVVIADRVQAHPRLPVAAARRRRCEVAIERLVLMPEDCYVQPGAYTELHHRPVDQP